MRVQTVRIHHYRSIRDLILHCGPTTVLLGPNNHGKSNLLGAFEFFFSSAKKPELPDFFHFRDNDPHLWVDVVFDGLNDQERTTFKKYVGPENRIRLRKTASIVAETGKVEVSYQGYLSQPRLDWLQEAKSGEFKKRDDLPPELAGLVPTAGRLTKQMVVDAQQAFLSSNPGKIEHDYALEDGPLLGLKNVAGGVLPDAFLVPAVRELDQDTAVKTTSLFGRLMSRAVVEMTETDQGFRQLRTDLDGLIQRLNRGQGQDERPQQLIDLESNIEKELRGWNAKLNIRIAPPEIDRVLELGTEIHVDDGVPTLAGQKGHGLQRAMIFALTRAWALALRNRPQQALAETSPRGRSGSVVLLIEEPELFLHPHAQRRLNESLREIAKSDHHQVFVCTHSPHFVRIDDYRNMAIVDKPSAEQGSRVRQCQKDLFAGEDSENCKCRFNMAHWINPERAELFFARRTVFVEGATERALIPFVADRLGCFDPDVSVIDCGSKFNLPLYMEIAGAFGLDHIVVHDEDPVPPTAEGDQLKSAHRTYAMNAKIAELAKAVRATVEILVPDFEGCIGVSKRQGEKKGKPLAAFDFLKDLDPQAIPERFQKLVRAVYQCCGTTAHDSGSQGGPS